MTPSPRLLLTGATGFIGRYLLQELKDSGYEVWVAVRSESNRSGLASESIVEVDYGSTAQMKSAFEEIGGFDYVVHNAGVTKCSHRSTFMEVNYRNTTRLLRALEALAQRPKCFFYMSSMSSFAPNLTTQPLRSDSPQQPITEYGRSKLAAEKAIAASVIPHVILCPTGVYGKGDQDYILSIQTMKRGFSFVSGTTPQLLSFVHVRDVARAVSFLLQHPESYGMRYLLSDGKDYTDQDFTEIVSQLIGRHVREVRVPLRLVKRACYIGDKVGKIIGKPLVFNQDKYPILAQHNWLCDITPLLSLGFQPQYDLRSGIAEALDLPRKENL